MAVASVAVLGTATTAIAQTDDRATQTANLPDAPTAQSPAQQPDQGQKSQLKQTIEVLGRRSIFFPELAHERHPLSSKQKLQLAVDETIAPSRFLGSAFTAGISQARNSLPDYGQGWEGYGKRYGSSVASNASSHLFGTFLLPSVTHEDPRYFVKLFGSPKSRILYAMTRVVVTRTDDGRSTFNWSNVMGGLMAEGLATSYLPDNERTAPKTFTRFGVRIGFSALDNVVKEYWPTIFKRLRVNRIIPPEKSDPGTVTPQVGPPAPRPQKEPQH
ncbi:MAG TPA: hypothetical protein VMP12_05715 [Candidatus Sulfotelmatobacter sp.]|nr:hypothetical protein [Candidatus Sulfotelmatobacter sp.]